MKKLLLGATAAIALCSVANAADLRLPVKAPPPVVVPAFSWTGCYVGGFVAAALNQKDPSVYDRDGWNVQPHSWNYAASSTFAGGGTLGCNWQPVGSQFVLGLEGELGYLDLSGSAYDVYQTGASQLVASSKAGDWYGMITGRLGYAIGQALIYAKGGAAFIKYETAISDPPYAIAVSTSETLATWTVGGGVEWAFDNNWSLKAEYMYIPLPSQTVTTVGGGLNWDFESNGIHTAKVGLNYRFGGFGAPVVARY